MFGTSAKKKVSTCDIPLLEFWKLKKPSLLKNLNDHNMAYISLQYTKHMFNTDNSKRRRMTLLFQTCRSSSWRTRVVK